MRFWKKKWYREVECKRCSGKGAVEIDTLVDTTSGIPTKLPNVYIRTCGCCNGRGTQTVLEREE